MNDIKPPLCEQISDMADGFLSGEERALATDSLMSSPQGIAVWHQYHVIGDVLRSAELAPTGDDHAFWTRLSARIELLPTRPQAGDERAVESAPVVVLAHERGLEWGSANASTVRWKRFAGLSSVAFVAIVGLGIWTQRASQENQPMAVAVSVEPTVPALQTVEGLNGVMLRDPQLDQLMVAHQQLGGHSALQLPAGFLRNATYEGRRQ